MAKDYSTTQRHQNLLLPIIICGLASLFYVYDYFIQVAPSVMTHQLMRSYHIGAGALGVLSASFYYSYIAMQIPAGMLLDKFGARKILAFAVFVSACGVSLFASTPIFALAALARFLIGAGSSFAFISALFLVARWFDHKHFAMIAGLVQLTGALGGLFGLAPLAIIINHEGWRHSMAWIGIITFMLAILFWLFIRDGQLSPDLAKTHTKQLNFRQRITFLLHAPKLWWVTVCGFMCWVPVGVVGALWGVPYLMKLFGWNNVTASSAVSLFWVGLGLGSPLIGWYSDRIQNRRKPFIVCFLMALIASVLWIFANHFSEWVAWLAVFLFGFSASIQSLSFGFIKDIVPVELFGSASGITNMAAILGSGATQTLIGYILHLTWNGHRHAGIPTYSITDYQLAFLVLPAAGLIGLIVSWKILK